LIHMYNAHLICVEKAFTSGAFEFVSHVLTIPSVAPSHEKIAGRTLVIEICNISFERVARVQIIGDDRHK
jgi:hypothetical protein